MTRFAVMCAAAVAIAVGGVGGPVGSSLKARLAGGDCTGPCAALHGSSSLLSSIDLDDASDPLASDSVDID